MVIAETTGQAWALEEHKCNKDFDKRFPGSPLGGCNHAVLLNTVCIFVLK